MFEHEVWHRVSGKRQKENEGKIRHSRYSRIQLIDLASTALRRAAPEAAFGKDEKKDDRVLGSSFS